jgi:hypothetical protein
MSSFFGAKIQTSYVLNFVYIELRELKSPKTSNFCIDFCLGPFPENKIGFEVGGFPDL